MSAIKIDTASLFSLIDFCGVLAGAMAGALEAKQNRAYRFDFVGVVGLGVISALGGGILRDVLLQSGPPLAFSDVRYLLIALVGASLGLLCGTAPGQWLGRLLILVDAAALGLFAVAGSTRAAGGGFSFLPAVLMGVITAVGGGALRDVLSGRTPRVFERGEPYAIAAAFVSILFLICNRWTRNVRVSTSIAVVVGFAIRVLALRFRWKTKAVLQQN
jgi:uncharacterized membrane protein YeiH